MKRFQVVVLGKPRGKPRHRVAVRRKKNGQAYAHEYPDPRGVTWEKNIAKQYWAQLTGKAPREPWTGPARLHVVAYFEPPKSWPKQKRKIAAEHHWHAAKKPDGDNIIKLVSDALNGVAWHDDAQVCVCSCAKMYAEQPRTEITIELLQKQSAAG